MISFDFLSLLVYLLPGYLISSVRHIIFRNLSPKEISRTIESVILSVLFYAFYSKTKTVINLLKVASGQDFILSDFLPYLPTLIALTACATLVYLIIFYVFIRARENLFHISRYQYVLDVLNGIWRKRNKPMLIYFKFSSSNAIYRGNLSKMDLDTGSDFLIRSVEIKEDPNDKTLKYTPIADDMLVNREKLDYIYTCWEDMGD